MDDDSDSHTRWPACHRCHSSKLRCRRAPGQRACNRCIRTQLECSPRPSRRGPGQQRTLGSSNVVSSVELPATTLDLNTRAVRLKAPPPPPKPLDSPSLAPMLQAMNDAAWPPLLSDLGLSPSPVDPRHYHDFFHLTPEMAFDTSNTLGHSPTQNQPQNQNRMDLISDREERLQGSARRLDAWVHELAQLNILLVNQQEAAAESVHALRASSASCSSSPLEESPEGEEEDWRHGREHDSLNLEETLRIALQLLSILRQSGPAHDPATALLLLSCYSRLAAIFCDVFSCLQPILDKSSTSPRLLSRLFPRVQLGSLWLGDSGSGRLQAEMALDASERVFSDISTKMESFIDKGEEPTTPGERTDKTPQSRRSTIGDVLDEGIRVAREERSAVSELVGKLRRALE
ncbi:hypothetical protein C8A05DRAFT_47918 [Staphylotrichum tortipilum]|uniref:Zn(2)-C6 fungal-type domain-containing protein n=1 Tax=Staphylotrichum tortipilum TaxID=2831512 RepID=A0AAN6MCE3_9PEZI|nr:hypothetical protein C8A05DRAFT_47918 [Staphylotrichum longicolle]